MQTAILCYMNSSIPLYEQLCVAQYEQLCFALWTALCCSIWTALFCSMNSSIPQYEKLCFALWTAHFHTMNSSDLLYKQPNSALWTALFSSTVWIALFSLWPLKQLCFAHVHCTALFRSLNRSVSIPLYVQLYSACFPLPLLVELAECWMVWVLSPPFPGKIIFESENWYWPLFL
jgi:hypothetical protein